MKVIEKNQVQVSILKDGKLEERVLNILPMTRAIRREVNNITFGGKEIKVGETMSMNFDNMSKAQDTLIQKLCGLSPEEVDSMDDKDFDLLNTYITDGSIPLTEATGSDGSSSKVKK